MSCHLETAPRGTAPGRPQGTSRSLSGGKRLNRAGVRMRAYLVARARAYVVRGAERRLARLDDVMLKDIGIGRCEIGRVVRYMRGA